jgi:hypothetical protein
LECFEAVPSGFRTFTTCVTHLTAARGEVYKIPRPSFRFIAYYPNSFFSSKSLLFYCCNYSADAVRCSAYRRHGWAVDAPNLRRYDHDVPLTHIAAKECGAIYSELHSAIFHETAVDTAAAISSA